MHNLTTRIIVAAICLLVVVRLQAQPGYFKNLFEHQKDSLLQVLKRYPNPDNARANALYNVVDCAMFLKEKKEVLPYWSEALALSRKLNDKYVEAACLAWRGMYYRSEQKVDSTITYLDSAIAIANNSKDSSLKKIRGFALLTKGRMYESQENLYAALQTYFDALKNYESDSDPNKKHSYSRIAAIYENLNNDQQAIKYYKLSQNNQSLAEIYFKRNDIPNTRFYLDKLSPRMPDTVETQVTGGYYRLLGKLALKENKLDSALNYYKESLKYFNLTRFMHTDLISAILLDMASLELREGNIAQAGEYLEQGMLAAKESGNKATLADAMAGQAEYDNKTGDQLGAYRALKQATLLNDSVLAEANIRQANTLAAIYENNKKEKEIARLQADEQLQAAAVKQKSLLNIVFLMALIALLLSGALLFRNFKSKQKLDAQQQLIQKQRIAQLENEKQLMAVEGMLKGQEEERSRLAKDLHDGLGGMLSGVKISFSNMKENIVTDSGNLALFEKSLQQLDNTIAELRKVSHNLMPEALVKFGLKNAVEDFCRSVETAGNTKIICEQLGKERELGNIADINVYRIIQELVNNALKHARATQILVQLTKAPNKVLITVEDDGGGFDPKELEQSRGIGFANIRYRVDYLNGKMDIESKPGEGTTVNIELTA